MEKCAMKRRSFTGVGIMAGAIGYLCILSSVVLLLSAPFFGSDTASILWPLLVLLAIVPLVFGWQALRRVVGRDELQQRIYLHGMMTACGLTGLISFAYGLLELA